MKEFVKLKTGSLVFSRDVGRLAKLNHLFLIHDTFSAGLITSGTGCRYEEALAILILLWRKSLLNGYLTAYETADAELPFMRRDMSQGLPKLPITIRTQFGTSKCISDPDDIFYDFEFELSDPNMEIEFEIEK